MANEDLTKAELIAKGKKLGLTLKTTSLKGDLVKAVNKAEKANTTKVSPVKAKGEYKN